MFMRIYKTVFCILMVFVFVSAQCAYAGVIERRHYSFPSVFNSEYTDMIGSAIKDIDSNYTAWEYLWGYEGYDVFYTLSQDYMVLMYPSSGDVAVNSGSLSPEDMCPSIFVHLGALCGITDSITVTQFEAFTGMSFEYIEDPSEDLYGYYAELSGGNVAMIVNSADEYLEPDDNVWLYENFCEMITGSVSSEGGETSGNTALFSYSGFRLEESISFYDEISFYDGLKSIDSDIFNDTYVNKVYIPASVVNVNRDVFSRGTLRQCYFMGIPEKIEDYFFLSIGEFLKDRIYFNYGKQNNLYFDCTIPYTDEDVLNFWHNVQNGKFDEAMSIQHPKTQSGGSDSSDVSAVDGGFSGDFTTASDAVSAEECTAPEKFDTHEDTTAPETKYDDIANSRDTDRINPLLLYLSVGTVIAVIAFAIYRKLLRK